MELIEEILEHEEVYEVYWSMWRYMMENGSEGDVKIKV